MNGELILDMPFKKYLGIKAINQSTLKIFSETSFIDTLYELEHPKPPSDAMMPGSAFHLSLLEPHRENEVILIPHFNKRRKDEKTAYEEFMSDHKGEILITAEQATQVRGMKQAVEESPWYPIFSDGMAEVTILWDDPETGCKCKARLDWISDSHDCSIDLKKIYSVKPDDMRRAIRNRKYHLQDWWYTWALQEVGMQRKRLMYLFVQDKPRHQVCMHYFDKETRRKSGVKMRYLLDRFAASNHNYNVDGIAEGYPAETEAQPIQLQDYEI